MKIFVTGIAGFLGSHLAERLVKMGHEVAGVDNLIGGDMENVPAGTKFWQADCNDRDAMLAALDHLGCLDGTRKKVDVVYHCAATAHEGLSVFSPHTITQNIVTATTGVLSAAISQGVGRFVFCSSMSRYGAQEVPFVETMKPKPQDPYAIGKVCAEGMVKLLCDIHGIEWVIVVPHNIIGARQRYCMAKGSVVKLKNSFKSIEHVRPGDIVSVHGKFAKVSDNFVVGKRPATRVKMSNGQILTVGKNHRFLVAKDDGTEWREASKLEPGDSLVSEVFDQDKFDKDSYDFKFGQFLGLLLSDGTYTDKYQVDISVCIKHDIPYCRRLLEELGFEGRDDARGNFHIYSRDLVKKLRALGMNDKGTRKHIPEQVLRLSHDTIAGVLSGLFSGDGWVAGGQKIVGLANTSEKLMRQAQILLMSFGIRSYLYRRDSLVGKISWIGKRAVRSQYSLWWLAIMGENVKRFQKIGFVYGRKNGVLERKVIRKESGPLPHLGVHISKVLPFLPLHVRRVAGRTSLSNGRHVYAHGQNVMTRYVVQRLLVGMDEWLSSAEAGVSPEYTQFVANTAARWRLALRPYHFVTVESVSHVTEELYDIAVDSDDHAYVGDGFVSHNCDPHRNVASIMANLMLQGRRPFIYGDGEQKRCFSFVGDVVDPLVQMATRPNVVGEKRADWETDNARRQGSGVWNVGPDDSFITINELFRELATIIGFNGEPIYMPGRPQEVLLANCSADKARAHLGYAPKTTLRDGLRSIVEHIREKGPKPFEYNLPVEIVNEKTPETWAKRLFLPWQS